jgi:hypothetical protein
LSFGPPSALRQKLHLDNMLLLARLEGKPKSGAIFVHLFISATLTAGFYLALVWMLEVTYQPGNDIEQYKSFHFIR